jgi:hypothetical protein
VVFRDVDTIEPGQDFAETIRARLRDCRVLLAVIGLEWLDARDSHGERRLDSPSDYVRLEIGAALARPDVLVIPVLVEGARMPLADQLPEALRPLAQRQAVALHDQDWDAGVDRLGAAIRDAGIGASPPFSTRVFSPDAVRRSLRMGWPLLAVFAVLVWIALGRGTRFTSNGPSGGSSDRAGNSRSEAGRFAPPQDVAIPRLCEVVDGDLVYSVISASAARSDTNQEVRVRVRVANDGRYDANFWDASFRLVLTGGATVAPHSGLNEIASSHSVRDAVVAFTVPAGVPHARLRIAAKPAPGEIPLDLTATGRPPRDEHGDAGDVLARAIVRGVLTEPRPLLAADGLRVTLTRIVARRFANATRLIVTVRYVNNTGYAASAGSLTLRAGVNDAVLAPVSVPLDVIESAAEATGDFIFDVPAAASRVTLRASLERTSANVSVEL